LQAHPYTSADFRELCRLFLHFQSLFPSLHICWFALFSWFCNFHPQGSNWLDTDNDLPLLYTCFMNRLLQWPYLADISLNHIPFRTLALIYISEVWGNILHRNLCICKRV
jgi:hypothetical protein